MAQAADMRVRELLRLALLDLRAADIQSPALDAQVLLAHVVGRTRTALLAGLDEAVSAAIQRRYEEFVQRRICHEPVAYLVGAREFWGREFRVSPAVLIPRPETELLVERALAMAGPSGIAVDVGTGSGCIALSFALERPGWTVYGTDTSPEALAIARQNVAAHAVPGRVSLLRGSLLTPVRGPFDLVIANLPYVPSSDIAGLALDVRAWEPRGALDGGPDGLDLIRSLVAQLPEKLRPGGVCLLELDPRHFDALDRFVASVMDGWQVIRHQDLSRRDRVAEVGAFMPS